MSDIVEFTRDGGLELEDLSNEHNFPVARVAIAASPPQSKQLPTMPFTLATISTGFRAPLNFHETSVFHLLRH
jgi:hypothetical protein